MHLDILKEKELKAVLKRAMASEKASDELKKQSGKLVRFIELFSVRNLFIVFFVVIGISFLLYYRERIYNSLRYSDSFYCSMFCFCRASGL